jgi:hypothetical protein
MQQRGLNRGFHKTMSQDFPQFIIRLKRRTASFLHFSSAYSTIARYALRGGLGNFPDSENPCLSGPGKKPRQIQDIELDTIH